MVRWRKVRHVKPGILRAFWTSLAGAVVTLAIAGGSVWGFLLVVAIMLGSFMLWPRYQRANRAELADMVMGATVGGTAGALVGASLGLILFVHGAGVAETMLLMTYTMAGMVGGTLTGLPHWLTR
jgi:hypothetical protein